MKLNIIKLSLIAILYFIFSTSSFAAYVDYDYCANNPCAPCCMCNDNTVADLSINKNACTQIDAMGNNLCDVYKNYFPGTTLDHKNQGFVNQKCVEPSPSSTYFSQKIRVIYKLCGFGLCGDHYADLSMPGECRYLVGIRYCGRYVPGRDSLVQKANKTGSSWGNNDPKPKMCVFQDPLGDPLDYDANYQPMNEGTPNPDITTSQSAGDAAKTLGVVAGIAYSNPLTVVFAPFITFAAVLAGIVSALYATINPIGGPNLGCVDIPAAPSPPPFCSTLSSIKPSASIFEICAPGQDSKSYRICVMDSNNNVNNPSNPSIRIAFSNMLPLCGGPDAAKGQDCVTIKNIEKIDVNSNTIISNYISTNCSLNNACIDQTSSSTKIQAGINYRILYATGDSSTSLPTPWYSSPPNTASIRVYGIDSANFADLTVGSSTMLLDPSGSGSGRLFRASLSNDSKQICVYEGSDNTQLIGCADKPEADAPMAIDCNSSNPPISCTTTHTKPNMIINYANINKILTPKSFMDKNGTLPDPNTYRVNIAGNYFAAVVTDDNYNLPKSYKVGNVLAGDMKGTYDSQNNYLYGLEYKDGVYVRGGTKMCIEGYSVPNNANKVDKNGDKITGKVIAKMVRALTLDGSTPLTNQDGSAAYDISLAISDTKPTYKDAAFTQGVPSYDITKCDYIKRDAGDIVNPAIGNLTCLVPCQSNCNGASFSVVPATISQVPNSIDYNSSNPTEAIRDMTGLEFDKNYGSPLYNPPIFKLCVDVPQPQCQVTSTTSETLPLTDAGKVATGVCRAGYQQAAGGAPTATCLANGDSASFGPVTNPCVEIPTATQCDAMHSKTLHANIPTTPVGQTGTGTCDANYSQGIQPPTAYCNNNGIFSPGGAASQCVYNYDCYNITSNNAIFPPSNLGQTVNGTCLPGYNGSPQAKCANGSKSSPGFPTVIQGCN